MRNLSILRAHALTALAVIGVATGVPDAFAQPHITYTTTDVGDFRGGAGGIAVDASGVIYVSDTTSGDRGVMRYVPAGAGTYTPSTVANSAVVPAGLAVDAGGNLYILDESGKFQRYLHGSDSHQLGNPQPLRVGHRQRRQPVPDLREPGSERDALQWDVYAERHSYQRAE